MLWTEEAVEDLKKLAAESAAARRRCVGSRNAVIGKASRIGIKLTGGGGRVAASGGAPARPARPHWAASQDTRPVASNLAVRSVTPRAAPAWTLVEAEIGEMRRLRFEDIRESSCRWPLGDPRSGDFAYCGLPPAGGQSYCAGHCRMAYRPPQARGVARERQGFRAIAGS